MNLSPQALHEWFCFLIALEDRWVNRIPLRDAQPALETNWLELIITRQSDGQILFQNNWITDHLINPENIAELACAGRARWKTENENP